jgi:hypothetical protein
MGFSFPTTLEGWIALGPSYGLSPAGYVPPSLYSAALASVQRNLKSAQNPPPQSQVLEVQAMIICRGLIYQKARPGDCGSPTLVDFSDVQIAQGAGQVAAGIASVAGSAIPGIGAAVQVITQIFAHHDQAVATEQQTLCSVTQVINQVIPYYDNLVRNGQISPGAALYGVQNFISQVNAKMQAIAKQCNASCVYISVLAAHSDFLQTWYPAIAPIGTFSHSPGAAPTSIIPTPPGGVIQVGNMLPTGESTAAFLPTTSPFSPVALGQSNNALLIGIVVVIGVIILALAG